MGVIGEITVHIPASLTACHFSLALVWFVRLMSFLVCGKLFCHRLILFQICTDSFNFLIPFPSIYSYWPQADQQYEDLPKATTVHLPPLSTRSCGSWSWPPGFCVYYHVTNVSASGQTCAANNHEPHEPHQPVEWSSVL